MPLFDLQSPKKVHEKSSCKALECLLCRKRYSREEILAGLYRLETFVCSSCYVKKQEQPHAKCCFGKPTFILKNRKVLRGYEPEAIECQELCQDREVCRILVNPENREIAFPV
jgi:hypothetical protein